MRVSLFLLFVTLILLHVVNSEEDLRSKEDRCGPDSRSDTVSEAEVAKSRKKRTVYLPNASFLSLQSRLIVPQMPLGLYVVWIRVRLVIRSMFTEQTS